MGMAALAGAVFGVVVYVINFYGMTQFFPWFAEARNWVSVLVHIVFGIVAAGVYMKLERRASNIANRDSGGSP
jgi:cytochrome c biogenesis protein CcdA